MSAVAQPHPATAPKTSRVAPGPYVATPGTTLVWASDGKLVALCEAARRTHEENLANARYLATLSTLPGLVSRMDAVLRSLGVQPRRASTRPLEELAAEVRAAVVDLERQS